MSHKITKQIKIISCNVISDMWYADHINEHFKVKQEFDTYFLLFFKQRIVFKEDALKIFPKNNIQQWHIAQTA